MPRWRNVQSFIITFAFIGFGQAASADTQNDILSGAFSAIEMMEEVRPSSPVWGGTGRIGGLVFTMATEPLEGARRVERGESRGKILAGLTAATTTGLKVGEALEPKVALMCRKPGIIGLTVCAVAVTGAVAASIKAADLAGEEAESAVASHEFQGRMNEAFAKQFDARMKSPEEVCPESQWSSGLCKRDGEKPAPEDETPNDELGWQIEGTQECVPLAREFKEFVEQDQQGTAEFCQLLQHSEENGALKFIQKCELVPHQPQYGTVLTNTGYAIVAPDHLRKIIVTEGQEATTLDYLQCQLPDSQTSEVDCSPQGQASYKASHGGRSVGYMCSDPL